MLAAWIGSMLFLAVAILYLLLALGLPYGDLAMGGKHKVMPKQMRMACVFSVMVQLFAIICTLQAGKIISIGTIDRIAQGACYFFACYLLLNTVMNALSKSNKERLVMTPLSFATAICLFTTAWNS